MIEESFYLTCGQRWLLHLLEKEPELARPVQRMYRLLPDVDTSAFLEAFQYAVASHPALRMQLVKTENGWRQCFPESEAIVSGEELQGRTPEMRTAYAGFLIGEHGRSTLDLTCEPPVKAKLIKVNGECILSLCVDHLAADEIAFDVFERELVLAYQKVINGDFMEASVSDAFITYINKEVASLSIEQSNLIYWKEHLKRAPRNPSNDNELTWVPASIWSYQVDGSTLQVLEDFCKAQKCSLFAVIVSTQLLLMSQISKTNDFVLNIPISNRPRIHERSIIANLSMLLHIRFTLLPDEPTSRFVLRVRDQILTAMSHRQYDYPKLSHCIAAQANGTSAGWLQGCNFIDEKIPLNFPNTLFEERMDNLPGRSYDIPKASFTLTAHHSTTSISISMDWDETVWPIKKEDMPALFNQILQRFES